MTGAEYRLSLDTRPMRGVDRQSQTAPIALLGGGVALLIGLSMGLTLFALDAPALRPMLLVAALQTIGGLWAIGHGVRRVLAARIITIGPGADGRPLVRLRPVRAGTGTDFDEPLSAYDAVVLERIIPGGGFAVTLRHPLRPERSVALARSGRLALGDARALAATYAHALGKPLYSAAMTTPPHDRR